MTARKALAREEIRAIVLNALGAIAPEVDATTLQPGDRLRDVFDLDSMDYLNFVIALGHDLAIDIPEADYGKMATLESCLDYLQGRVTSR